MGLDLGRLRPGVRGQGLWPLPPAPDNAAPCSPAWAAGTSHPGWSVCAAPIPPGSLKGVVKPACVRGRMEALYFVSTAGMGLQNHPHARLAPVIPVNKMGKEQEEVPMAPGGGAGSLTTQRG